MSWQIEYNGNRDLDLRHNGKPIGQIKVDMRYMPVSKPIPRDDGTVEPAAESSMYIYYL